VKVKVQFFAAVRELVGSREETIELEGTSTVRCLLDTLVKRHGEPLKAYLFDPKSGYPRSSIQFLIDDKPVQMRLGLDMMISDGSVFAIIPPVGGG